MTFEIADLPLLSGRLGICPMPGRDGRYGADFAAILNWSPHLVLTMTTMDELKTKGADGLPNDLSAKGIAWIHLPIPDFGTPPPLTAALWPQASQTAQSVLDKGGRVLVHCMGGCGRSGMAVMRLMVESGEPPDQALLRLRTIRPCAVETAGQQNWASTP